MYVCIYISLLVYQPLLQHSLRGHSVSFQALGSYIKHVISFIHQHLSDVQATSPDSPPRNPIVKLVLLKKWVMIVFPERFVIPRHFYNSLRQVQIDAFVRGFSCSEGKTV